VFKELPRSVRREALKVATVLNDGVIDHVELLASRDDGPVHVVEHDVEATKLSVDPLRLPGSVCPSHLVLVLAVRGTEPRKMMIIKLPQRNIMAVCVEQAIASITPDHQVTTVRETTATVDCRCSAFFLICRRDRSVNGWKLVDPLAIELCRNRHPPFHEHGVLQTGASAQ
jgi:hypothetical protein